jgi:small-conductance mechanosensitive channel
MLVLWFELLTVVDDVIKTMVEDQQEINKFPAVQKMQGIVKSITRHSSQEPKRQEHRQDHHEGDQEHQKHRQAEKDLVYCFKETNTVPAKVLAYIWWLYYFFAHIIGGLIFIAVLLQDQETICRFIIGGLLVSGAASGSLMFELGPNTISLLRLSLYKPFYVGDLITLNSTGSMNSPATSIMGFVENITMMYVVIRNFEMKQTWISHDVFNKIIILNWTRRPTKTVLLNIGVSCRCPLSRVEKLVTLPGDGSRSLPRYSRRTTRSPTSLRRATATTSR